MAKKIKLKTVKLKILKPLKSYLPGRIISIKVDRDGIAMDRYWRNRISDSRVDKCVEIIENKASKTNKKTGANINDTASKTAKNNS